MKNLGVLRTVAGSNYSPDTGTLSQDEYGNSVRHWARIPDKILRNDGYHDLLLFEGFTYRFRHDSVGWLFYREDETNPHRYLAKKTYGGDVALCSDLELAHTTMVMSADREYVVELDDTGAWRILETADVTTA